MTLAVFPEGSEKVYVTGVLPTGKNELGCLVLLTKVTMPELSVAVGSSKATVLPGLPLGTVTVMSSTLAIIGATSSTEMNET